MKLFESISKGGTGTLILLVESALKLFGVDAPEGSVGNIVEGVVALIGLILLIVHQFERKDLVAGIVRK